MWFFTEPRRGYLAVRQLAAPIAIFGASAETETSLLSCDMPHATWLSTLRCCCKKNEPWQRFQLMFGKFAVFAVSFTQGATPRPTLVECVAACYGSSSSSSWPASSWGRSYSSSKRAMNSNVYTHIYSRQSAAGWQILIPCTHGKKGYTRIFA